MQGRNWKGALNNHKQGLAAKSPQDSQDLPRKQGRGQGKEGSRERRGVPGVAELCARLTHRVEMAGLSRQHTV